MSIPDIHDALMAMEQVGLRPQCMALRCQHAGCREEIQIDTGEALAVDAYLAECCSVYGWDDEEYLCPEHQLRQAVSNARYDAEWALEAEREDAA